jgi:hypothetical protein
MQRFVAAPDQTAVLSLAGVLAQRPALVVAALSQLALLDQRRRRRDPAQAGSDAGLVAIGQFVAGLQRRFGPAQAEPVDRLPALPPPPGLSPDQTGLTAALIADPGFAQRLAETLETGAAARRQIREQVAVMIDIDLEGVAFGTLLPATRIIDELKGELEQVRVQAAGAPG